jgi:hypothetical protein
VGWDAKQRGARSGYFYASVRVADGVRKVYYGRRTAGKLMAAAVEKRREDRRLARELVRAERENAAGEDRLAAELRAWAVLLSRAWLILSGHHNHHGCWRRKKDG